MKDESRVRRRTTRRASGGAAPRWSPAAGWRDLLVGRDPEAILARIAEDDPLDLRRLCALRLRAAAVLVDPDRVHLGALSLLAFSAATDGPPDRRRVVVDLVDRVVDECIADAALEGLTGGGAGAADVFATFAAPLQLAPDALARACEAFNARPAEQRAAFFALVVDRLGLEEAARAAGASPIELARDARRALDAALAAAGVARDAAAPRPASDSDALEVPDGAR